MLSRRRAVFVLPFLLSSLAAAQVRPVPAEAGTAPLAIGARFTADATPLPITVAPSAMLSGAPAPGAAAFTAQLPSMTAAPVLAAPV
ncbi:MAG: hypothetical protein ACHQ51_13220, partial [Elusimicrobiota bacterium]